MACPKPGEILAEELTSCLGKFIRDLSLEQCSEGAKKLVLERQFDVTLLAILLEKLEVKNIVTEEEIAEVLRGCTETDPVECLRVLPEKLLQKAGYRVAEIAWTGHTVPLSCPYCSGDTYVLRRTKTESGEVEYRACPRCKLILAYRMSN